MVIVLSTDFLKEKVEEYILYSTTVSASAAMAGCRCSAPAGNWKLRYSGHETRARPRWRHSSTEGG
jgi:hypothetical protein